MAKKKPKGTKSATTRQKRKPASAPQKKIEKPIEPERGYVDITMPPDDAFNKSFEHLYERADQIELVKSALVAAIRSEFNNRFHCVLVGEPAGGKTELLRCVKNALGEAACLEYDATSTTQAGAIKDLDSREKLPRILLVEEIEKVEEKDNSLRWMLSLLDHRAEITKITAFKKIHRSTEMLCLATANDYDKFLSMMSGALASRFAHHIYCPRPGWALLEQILKREVENTPGGNLAWIDHTLAYAKSKDITDPRKVISICLCGRDALLKNEYQKLLDRTNPAEFLQRLRQR